MTDVCFRFRLGIKGTKAYRKPLWVTQMEELREQLQGKCNVDSLDACCVYTPEPNGDVDDDEPTAYGTYFPDYDVKGAFYLSPIQEHSEPSSSDGGTPTVDRWPIADAIRLDNHWAAIRPT